MNNRLLLAYVIISRFTNNGIFVLKIVMIEVEKFQRYIAMKSSKRKEFKCLQRSSESLNKHATC